MKAYKSINLRMIAQYVSAKKMNEVYKENSQGFLG